MSGISALLYLDARHPADHEIRSMIESMRHRGPDGRNVMLDGPAALGHGMLRTTPESLFESYPVQSRSSGCMLTADARIDNRRELCRELDLDEASTDGRIILAAYEKWGKGCPEHLIGDFTFAIWDPGRKSLFCAKDHLGIRPLYYYFGADRLFACATEIKALLQITDIPAVLNETRIADYLTGMREDMESTIYKGILRLPPAHALEVEGGKLRLWRYYRLAPAVDVPEMDDEGYAQRFKELFEEAVRCRVRSAFPVGSQLSGGLDSSYVTCVARDVLKEDGRGPLHTYSLEFPETTSCDETEYVEAVLKQGGINAHYVNGDEVGALSNVEEVYSLLDDDLIGGTQHMVWALFKAAQDSGVRIVLDGLDGDQVVGHGTQYLQELAHHEDWATLAREISMLRQRFSNIDHRHNFEDTFASSSKTFSITVMKRLSQLAEEGAWIRFARSLQGARKHFVFKRRAVIKSFWKQLLIPQFVREWRRSKKNDAPEPRLQLLDLDFAEEVSVKERIQQFENQNIKEGDLRTAQMALLDSGIFSGALETTDHFASMLGLYVVHPFLDIRLVEFCLALPPQQSLKDGWTRVVMRRAMKGVVPEKIRCRPGKTWLGPSYERALFDNDLERLNAYLRPGSRIWRYVSRDAAMQMKAAGPALSNDTQARLGKAAILSKWLDLRFADTATYFSSDERPRL